MSSLGLSALQPSPVPQRQVIGIMAFVAIVSLVLVLKLVQSAYEQRKAEQRQADLASFARTLGLNYQPWELSDRREGGMLAQVFVDPLTSDEGKFLGRFMGFEPFGIGHSPEVTNLIYGERNGLDWAIFDYTYRIGRSSETSSPSTYHTTVVCGRTGLMLPTIDLEPENLLHRIRAKLGMSEVTFELEEFNRRYFVKAQDERQAYDIIHPRAIEYLMGLPSRHWQISGFQVMLYERRLSNVREIGRQMAEIEGFIKLVPDYVKQDHGFQPQWEGPF